MTLTLKFLKLTGFCVLIFSFGGCRSLPEKPSEDVSLKMTVSGKGFVVAAFVFIKEDKARVDILKPFSGPFGHLYLKDDRMVFLIPEAKKYYQGAFNSRIVFPQIKNLPAQWILSLLKGEPPSKESCFIQKQKTYCKTGDLVIFLEKQSSKKSAIVLKPKRRKEIKIKIRRLSEKALKEEIFIPPVSGYQPVRKWQDL